MAKKRLQSEHKIGITAIICLLLGGLIAFVYMYSNGNKIVIMPNADSEVHTTSQKGKNKKDTIANYTKPKRYNIYNYYYPKTNGQFVKDKVYRDTLPKLDKENFVRIEKITNDNLILDLNLCDTLDLQMIRGIGPTFARRICKYREKLGGYVKVEQLREVYGIDEQKYQAIRKYFTIGEEHIRKVNINSLNIKELMTHPYIDRFLAKEIIVFHQNYGAYSDVNQLKAVHLMSDSLFDKLVPYLRLE